MVLVQAENLSPPLCISSQCKMQGDCQWGKDGRKQERGSLKAADIHRTSSAHVFWSFRPVGHSVHSRI